MRCRHDGSGAGCRTINSADKEACAKCRASLKGAGHPMEGAGKRRARPAPKQPAARPRQDAADGTDSRIRRLEEANACLQ